MNDALNRSRIFKPIAMLLVLIMVVVIAGCSLQNNPSSQRNDQTTNDQTGFGVPSDDMGPPPDDGGTPPDMPTGQGGGTPGAQQ